MTDRARAVVVAFLFAGLVIAGCIAEPMPDPEPDEAAVPLPESGSLTGTGGRIIVVEFEWRTDFEMSFDVSAPGYPDEAGFYLLARAGQRCDSGLPPRPVGGAWWAFREITPLGTTIRSGPVDETVDVEPDQVDMVVDELVGDFSFGVLAVPSAGDGWAKNVPGNGTLIRQWAFAADFPDFGPLSWKVVYDNTTVRVTTYDDGPFTILPDRFESESHIQAGPYTRAENGHHEATLGTDGDRLFLGFVPPPTSPAPRSPDSPLHVTPPNGEPFLVEEPRVDVDAAPGDWRFAFDHHERYDSTTPLVFGAAWPIGSPCDDWPPTE